MACKFYRSGPSLICKECGRIVVTEKDNVIARCEMDTSRSSGFFQCAQSGEAKKELPVTKSEHCQWSKRDNMKMLVCDQCGRQASVESLLAFCTYPVTEIGHVARARLSNGKDGRSCCPGPDVYCHSQVDPRDESKIRCLHCKQKMFEKDEIRLCPSRDPRYSFSAMPIRGAKYFRAVVNNMTVGVQVPLEIISLRFSQCMNCEKYVPPIDIHRGVRTGWCFECTCNVSETQSITNKLAFSEEYCPHPDGSKWGVYRPEDFSEADLEELKAQMERDRKRKEFESGGNR